MFVLHQAGPLDFWWWMTANLVILITLEMQKVGLSPALGTFLAGVVLAESEYRHELEANIEPFKGLLLGLFFLSVGAGINFTLLIEQPGLVLGLDRLILTGRGGRFGPGGEPLP